MGLRQQPKFRRRGWRGGGAGAERPQRRRRPAAASLHRCADAPTQHLYRRAPPRACWRAAKDLMFTSASRYLFPSAPVRYSARITCGRGSVRGPSGVRGVSVGV